MTLKQRASKIDALAAAIVADFRISALTGQPRKYPTFDSVMKKGGNLHDIPLPTGKTLGQSTGAEVALCGEAYSKAADRIDAGQW